MTCPKLVESGVYVLGALPPGQRLDYERHLTTCAECRTEVGDLAVLPGLLGRLDEASVAMFASSAEPAPPNVVPMVLGRIRRQRRNRRLGTLVGAVAAACLAVVAVVFAPGPGPGLVGSGPRPSSSITLPSSPSPSQTAAWHPMVPMPGENRLTADVTLTAVDGGTRIDVICRYSKGPIPPEYHGGEPGFALYAIPVKHGPAQLISSWRAWPGSVVTAPGMSWWRMAGISRLELQDERGNVLMQYKLT